MGFFYFHFYFFQMPLVHSGGGCCRCHNQWGKYGSVGSVVVGVHGVKTMTKTRKDEKTDLFVRYWFEFGQKSDDNDFVEWLFGKYLLKTRFVKVIRSFVYKITERKLWIVVCSSPDTVCCNPCQIGRFDFLSTCNKKEQFCCPFSTDKCISLAFRMVENVTSVSFSISFKPVSKILSRLIRNY